MPDLSNQVTFHSGQVRYFLGTSLKKVKTILFSDFIIVLNSHVVWKTVVDQLVFINISLVS